MKKTLSYFRKRAIVGAWVDFLRSIKRFIRYRFFKPINDFYELVIFTFRASQMSFGGRFRFIKQSWLINRNVDCPHTNYQITEFSKAILSIPNDEEGCIVEAGTFKGGSAAKFSLIAKMVNRQLFCFDSFEGLPDNKEQHDRSILGHSIKDCFAGGTYRGTLEEVKNNVAKYGKIKYVTFVKGWLDDTMPKFCRKICAIYLDVDLASSTKTCLKYLYPLLNPGGWLFSQDGDFPLVIDVFNDDKFWEEEIGYKKPYIRGLGKNKLISIQKPFNNDRQILNKAICR